MVYDDAFQNHGERSQSPFQGIEVIEVEDSPPQTDTVSIHIDENVVQHQMISVDNWTSQVIPSGTSISQVIGAGVQSPFQGIEVIEVEDSPPQTDTVSIHIEENVVQHQMISVDNWTSQVIPSGTSISQSTDGTVDDTLVDNSALPFVFLSGLTQVQNQSMEAHPETIIFNEHSAVHSGSSGTAVDAKEEALTKLRLGLYQPETEINVTNFFKMESGQSNHVRDNETEVVAAVSEAEEVTLKCPVCFDPLKDETSTICGHIFCHECIKASIKAQKKCPTCRRKLNLRNIHRVYLPKSF